jgi:hypothetical protein
VRRRPGDGRRRNRRRAAARALRGLAAAGLDGGDELQLGVIRERALEPEVGLEEHERALLDVDEAGGTAGALNSSGSKSGLPIQRACWN